MVTSGQQAILFNSIELCCMVLCVFTCISSSAPVAIRRVSLDLFHVWYCILFFKKNISAKLWSTHNTTLSVWFKACKEATAAVSSGYIIRLN